MTPPGSEPPPDPDDWRRLRVTRMEPGQDAMALGLNYRADFWQSLPRVLTMPFEPSRLLFVVVAACMMAPAYTYALAITSLVNAQLIVQAPPMLLAVAIMVHSLVAGSQGRRAMLPENFDKDLISFVLSPLWRIAPGLVIAFGPLVALHVAAASTPLWLLGALWALLCMGPMFVMVGLGHSPLRAFTPGTMAAVWATAPQQLLAALGVFFVASTLGWGVTATFTGLLGMPYGFGVGYAVALAFGQIAAQSVGVFTFCHDEALAPSPITSHPPIEDIDAGRPRAVTALPPQTTEARHADRIQRALAAEVQHMEKNKP